MTIFEIASPALSRKYGIAMTVYYPLCHCEESEPVEDDEAISNSYYYYGGRIYPKIASPALSRKYGIAMTGRIP